MKKLPDEDRYEEIKRHMKKYMKPVITVDAGLAEGVYAASGAA